MRYSITIILLLLWGQGLSQPSYDSTLSLRLDQIRKMTIYNNTVVVALVDSIDYSSAAYPYWKPDITFYESDICRYKYCQYRALTDSVIGIRPDTSQSNWKLIDGPPPYLYLRDTAKIEDLKKLVTNEHPFIRTYAFAALSFRKYDNLFPVIVENLGDSTKIEKITFHGLNDSYPAALMIEYEADRLSKAEKKKLKTLINKKYKYLSDVLSKLE